MPIKEPWSIINDSNSSVEAMCIVPRIPWPFPLQDWLGRLCDDTVDYALRTFRFRGLVQQRQSYQYQVSRIKSIHALSVKNSFIIIKLIHALIDLFNRVIVVKGKKPPMSGHQPKYKGGLIDKEDDLFWSWKVIELKIEKRNAPIPYFAISTLDCGKVTTCFELLTATISYYVCRGLFLFFIWSGSFIHIWGGAQEFSHSGCLIYPEWAVLIAFVGWTLTSCHYLARAASLNLSGLTPCPGCMCQCGTWLVPDFCGRWWAVPNW